MAMLTSRSRLLVTLFVFACLARVALSIEAHQEVHESLGSLSSVDHEHHAEVAEIQSTASAVASGQEAHGEEGGLKLLVKLLENLLSRLQDNSRKAQLSYDNDASRTAKSLAAEQRKLIHLRKAAARGKDLDAQIVRANELIATQQQNMVKLVSLFEAARKQSDVVRGQADAELQSLRSSAAENKALIELLQRVLANLNDPSANLLEVSHELSVAQSSEASTQAALAALHHSVSSASPSELKDVTAMVKTLLAQLSLQATSLQQRIKSSEAVFATRADDLFRLQTRLQRRRQASSQRLGQLQERLNHLVATSRFHSSEVQISQKLVRAVALTIAELQKVRLQAKLALRDALRHNERQIRVLKKIIRMLRSRNGRLSQRLISQLSEVKVALSVWKTGDWSQCSAQCGLGQQTRSVTCQQLSSTSSSPAVTVPCAGRTPEASRVCSLRPCPSDCVLSEWTSWGPCSKPCGSGGLHSRSRSVVQPALNGGQVCPPEDKLRQTRGCNAFACTDEQR